MRCPVRSKNTRPYGFDLWLWTQSATKELMGVVRAIMIRTSDVRVFASHSITRLRADLDYNEDPLGLR